MTYLELSRKYPPILCRLLATVRKRGDLRLPLTEPEIAQRSGLTLLEVHLMTRETSWNEIPFGKMEQFQQGCNVIFSDWRNMDWHKKYLVRQSQCPNPWASLRETKEWLHYYDPLLKRYARSLV